MTTATSLILIAAGAILAFAVSYSVGGINIQTVGIILMVVGAIGLALSVATIVGYAPWGGRNATASAPVATPVAAPAAPVPPASPPATGV
jgi:hypothetical protein